MKAPGQQSKKLLSVFLSAVMVAQMYSAPIQTAYASSGLASSADAVSARTLEGPDANGNANADDVSTDEPATVAENGDTQNGNTAASGENNGSANAEAESTAAGSGEDGSDVKGKTEADSNDAEADTVANNTNGSDADAKNPTDEASGASANSNASLKEETITLASADGNLADASGAYNPNADPVAIDSTSGTIKATLSYDEEGSKPYEGEAILPTDTLYATVDVVFHSNKKPTLEYPNVSYTLPNNVTVASKASSVLLDSKGNSAGTWEISGNTVLLKFSDTWLNAQTSEISASFKLHFTLSNQNQGDGGEAQITFPGTSTVVKIPTKDGNVTGEKSAANYDADDSSYTWTIKIKPATYATNLTVNDEIGSNLEFVPGSFKVVDQNNKEIDIASSDVYSVNFSGSKATFSLGNLEAGTYKIVYKTKVNESALNGLSDGTALGNVNNKCSWSWGSTDPKTSNEINVTPQAIKYSMVSKSASGTNSDITWTVKLNTGTLKADMSNYNFTDTLGEGHHFIDGTQYTVTDANNNQIATGDVDASSNMLTFTLPAAAGKQTLTVTYHTAMNSVTSLNQVKNTAEVTPEGEGVGGKGEGTYTPTDTATYVKKSFISRTEDGATATWTSTIKFSNMAADTDVAKIKWVDSVSRSIWASFKFSDLVLKAGDATLVEGVDYTVSSLDSGTCTVTFKDSSTVKGLVNKTDVVVTYKTTLVSDGDNPIASGQKFTNTSVLNYDNVKKDEASDDYSIVTVPNVIKKANGSKWDAGYTWSDGTTGAWVISWEAWVNSYGSYHDSILDLGKNDVILTDTLPEGMEYKSNSFKYVLEGNDGYNNIWETTGDEPTVSGNTVTFKVSTAKAVNDAGSWVGKAKFLFQTVVKNDIGAGETKSYSNSASAESGDYKFPSGTGTTTIKNDVLSKSHTNEDDGTEDKGGLINYAITVNPNALDLVKGDTLTLVDTMSSTLSFVGGSLKVADVNGNDVTSSCSLNVENSTSGGEEKTVLTIGVPDATKLTVTYKCLPIGIIGKDIVISNSCALNGMTNTAKQDSTSWTVAKAHAIADAVSYGLSVKKAAQNDTSKVLGGAKFRLSSVDLATFEKTMFADGVTGADGTLNFGDKNNPLHSGTLYYVEETEAPKGYEISYEGTYVLFYPATATEQAISEFNAANAAAKNHGITPVVGTISDDKATGPGVAITVYDKLESGNFTLKVNKGVSGSYKDGAAPAFTFTATATGDNAELAPKLSDVSITGAGEAYFKGQLTEDMIGKIFTYELKEVKPDPVPAGWTYDEKTVAATVKVVSDGEKISADVSYSKNGESVNSAQFSNTYVATGKAIVNVAKQVNGADPAADAKFNFQISSDDAAAASKLPETTTVTTTGAAVASFEALSFNQEDAGKTYTYTIKETSELGTGWTKAADVTVTVTVGADKGDGTLEASKVVYTNATTRDDKTAALFNNTYATSAKATIQVNKTVVGGTEAVEGETFDFTLKKDGKTVDSITGVEDGGTKSFKELSFDKAGDYNYVVTEDGHNTNGWKASADVDVTVSVTENDDRTLTATVKYGTSDTDTAAKFTDTYEATGNATINVEKTVNGGSVAAEGEEFTFDLYNAKQDNDGKWVKDGTAIQTGLKVKANGTASFDALAYSTLGGEDLTKVSDGDALHYVIHETGHNTNGWTAADDVVATVIIREDGTKGTLSADVTYSNGTNAAAFDDIYTEGTSAQLKATKTLTGRDAVANEFEFRVYKLDEQGNKVGDPVATAKNVSAKDGEVSDVTFSSISYDTADTYNYQIEEFGGNDGKVKYDQTVYKATVTVTKDAATGKLSANVKYFNADGTDRTEVPAFKNTFSYVGVNAVIKASKSLAGANIADYNGKFEFELRSNDGVYLYATAKNDEKGFVDFTLNFTQAGTYTYKIVERAGSDDNMFYDGNFYYVQIEVSGNTSSLTVEGVTYYASDGVTEVEPDGVVFANTKSTAAATIKVDKTVNGVKDGDVNEKFTFELLDKDGKKLDGVTVDGTSTAAFDELTYDKAGDYKYTVHETSDLGDGWFNAGDVQVTVHVSRDEQNKKLVATVDYGDSTVDAAKFDDIHRTESAELKVYKTVNGGDIAEGEKFTFKLLDKDGNQIGEEKAADKTNPVATFDKIEYETEGTYAYTIHETTVLTDGWVNDADVPVTVTVKRDEEAKTLKVESVDYGERAYEMDGQVMAHFDDKYSTAVDAGIEVSKTVNGGTEAVEGEWFEFELAGEDGKTVVSTAKAQAGQTVAFEGVKYTTADAGKEFKYTIREVGHNDKGWTADSDVDVTVKVSQNDDRTLSTEVTYGRGTNAAEFTNTYATAGTVTVQVYKTVNGGTEAKPGERFTFELRDADGKTVDAVETEAGEVASFKALELTRPGTWTYTVHETGHDGNGWTAASDVTATVTATDNGDGTLTATVEYSNANQGAAGFDDKYEATGSAAINVEKTVNGGTEAAEGEEFTFDLYKADEGGKAEGEPIDTVSVKAGATASFSALGYTFADAGKEFTYIVHETGHNTDGWVADSDVTAVVKVTDNGDGTLKAEVTYSRGTNAAAFDDKYDTAATATIQVTKTVNGGTEAVAGEWFEFELLDKEGNKVGGAQAVKTQAGGTASFSALSYSLADAGKTFEYTVHEVGHNDKGWTADSDVAVTVKVVKNADLTLSTEVTYGRGTNAAEFTNTYATAGELEVKISKTVNGGKYADDREFTFGLFETDVSGAKTGEAIATAKVKAGQTAVLDGVFYDQDNAGQTYTYVVSELGDLGSGWTKAADQKVTVKVTDNGDGTMKATVDYGSGKTALAFDNKYEQPSTGKKTTTTKSSTKSGTTPKTGDPVSASFALVAAAGLALVANGLRRRREN